MTDAPIEGVESVTKTRVFMLVIDRWNVTPFMTYTSNSGWRSSRIIHCQVNSIQKLPILDTLEMSGITIQLTERVTGASVMECFPIREPHQFSF